MSEGNDSIKKNHYNNKDEKPAIVTTNGSSGLDDGSMNLTQVDSNKLWK